MLQIIISLVYSIASMSPDDTYILQERYTKRVDVHSRSSHTDIAPLAVRQGETRRTRVRRDGVSAGTPVCRILE
jgi:hypothetical protein